MPFTAYRLKESDPNWQSPMAQARFGHRGYGYGYGYTRGYGGYRRAYYDSDEEYEEYDSEEDYY